MEQTVAKIEGDFARADGEKPEGANVLHKAVYTNAGYLVINFLLKKKPELSLQKDSRGDTPAMLAARMGSFPTLVQILRFSGVSNIIEANKIMYLMRTADVVEREREHMIRLVERIIQDNIEKVKKPQARTLAAAEQTILRGPSQLGKEGLAPPGSALARAMNTGILQSQVGKFLTSKPIGDSVKPAIRELRRDITGKGRRKRFSTRRRNKRNVRK